MSKNRTLLLTTLFQALIAFTCLTLISPGSQSAYVEPGLKKSGSAELSVIVRGRDATSAARAIRSVGGLVSADLWLIDGVAGTIPAGELQSLADSPGVQTISANKYISSAETFPIDSPYMEDSWSTELRTKQYPEGVNFTGWMAFPPLPLPDGGVFAVMDSGKVLMMNSDGTVRASFTLSDPNYYETPVVDSGGTIYITGEKTLHAINPDGTSKWDISSTLEFQSGLGIYENGNILYAVTGDETSTQLLGLSTVDGEILFTTPSENGENLGDFDAPPTVDAAGFGYIVSDEGYLYKLEPSGDIAWSAILPTPHEYRFRPQVRPDGSILLASSGGRITVVDPSDGSQVYTFYPETGGIEDQPAIGSDGSVYVAIGSTHIFGIDPQGSQKFDFYSGDSDFGSSPQLTLDESQVIVSSFWGTVHALDSTTGTQNWSYYTGLLELLVDHPIITPGGNIIFGDVWGQFYVFSPDGLPLYHDYFNTFVYAPTISSSGTVFFGVLDIFQFAFEEMIALPRLPNEWDEVTPDVQPGSSQTDYRVLNPISIDLGADILHENGVDGSGVGIAVVDSGVYFDDDTHNYLGDEVQDHFLGQVDFIVDEAGCLAVSGTWDPVEAYCTTDSHNSKDGFGHGSHVAGIIWNNMTDYNTGVTLGVAPDASILSVRVLGDNGGGSYADVIEGIQYVVANKDAYTPTIRVLNLSLTAVPTSPYFADPLNIAVEEAWAAGIVVLAASGNVGPQCETITVPGNNPYVITIGGLDSQRTPGYWPNDDVAAWSATGPTYDGFIKPDVLAPGANVVSYMYNGDGELPYLVQVHPDYSETTSLFRMNGTSMATAAASGVAALMLEHNPSLTPDQVKFRMMYSGQQSVNQYDEHVEVVSNIFQQGAGRIWAPAAVYGDLPVDGLANVGMDILADLSHGWETPEEIVFHYEGPVRKVLSDDGGVYLYFVDAGDGTAMALGAVDVATGLWLYDDDLNELAELQPGGELVWTSGQMVWAGGQMAWAGGQMVWAGGQMVWAGGQMAWAGGQMAWAGGQMVWAGTQYIEGGGSARYSEELVTSSSPDDEGDTIDGELVWSGSQTDWLGGEMVWEPGLQVWDGGHIDPEEAQTDPNPWVDDVLDEPNQNYLPLILR